MEWSILHTGMTTTVTVLAVSKRNVEDYTRHHFASHARAEVASCGAVSIVSDSNKHAGAGEGRPTVAAGRLAGKVVWVLSEQAVHALRPELPAGTYSLAGRPHGVAAGPQGSNGAPTELVGPNPETTAQCAACMHAPAEGAESPPSPAVRA